MKLYFDTCCYSRPYDNPAHQSQESVEAETIAIEGAVDLCRVLGFPIVGSPAVLVEIGKINDDEKRRDIRNFYDRVINEFVDFNDEIFCRAQEIRKLVNIKNYDSFHIALAEAANVDFLLTTDDRFERASGKLELKTKVVNPINFLGEFVKWAQSLT